MKNIRNLIMVFMLVLSMIFSMSVVVFAGDNNEVQNKEQVETNLLENGFIILDKDGNVLPQPRFTIGENISVRPGETVVATRDCWYNGGRIDFYISLTGGGDVEYFDVSIWAPKAYRTHLGSFSRVNNQSWYGKYSVNMENVYLIDPSDYYNYALTNTSEVTLKVGSFTAINDI